MIKIEKNGSDMYYKEFTGGGHATIIGLDFAVDNAVCGCSCCN
jgi:hypothetical protein